METAYKNLSLFFVIILAFVVWGFFKSYFGLFPGFNGVNAVQHFHGIMMLSWFAMLIAQPLLIRYNKIALHKALGKISYLQVPLILLSIFMISRMEYIRNEAVVPHAVNVGGLALNLPDIFAFAALYMLAMVNKKNTAYHMRYMIGTSLLLIGPGLGRGLIIYGGLPFPVAIEYTIITTEVICLALIVYDLIKHRPYKPYVITLAILIAMHICWEFQMAAWWQAFAGKFAALFF